MSQSVNLNVRSAMRLLAAILGIALFGSAFGQAAEPTIVVSAPPKQVAINSKVTFNVFLEFAEGFHGYQNPPAQEFEIPVTIKVDGTEFKVVKVAYPAGEDASVGGTTSPTKTYSGRIKIPVTVQMPAKVGAKKMRIVASYQQCDETKCFPPSQVFVDVKLNVVKKVSKG